MRELWPHQRYGLERIAELRAAGSRAICVTSPTGGGKTELIIRLILEAVDRNERAALYTNRRLLLDQLSRALTDAGIEHGKRASEYEPRLLEAVQVASIQTELSRVLRQLKWEIHKAHLVIIDEAHQHKERTACRIIEKHQAMDATIIGFTATPVGIGHIYSDLVVAGTNSELRDCGALVPTVHYGPDEPDLRHIKVQNNGEFSRNDIVKAQPPAQLFGRVRSWFEHLNPEWHPTLLFAPGVRESLWFAKKFTAAGIPAAHIDGQDVWYNGELHPTAPDIRQQIIDDHADGKIAIICNRFVLREGINMPWVRHGILATPFGSVVSYLQAGGRLLRSWLGKDRVIIQDHGGNWWRHGSLNWDRQWDMNLGAKAMSTVLQDRFRTGKAREPARCPQCTAILCGPICPQCGYHVGEKRERLVVMVNGKLVRHTGKVWKARKETWRQDTERKWKSMYYRAKKSRNKMTFAQAIGLFVVENHYWPPKTLPYMPRREMDWHRRVRDVPADHLIGTT